MLLVLTSSVVGELDKTATAVFLQQQLGDGDSGTRACCEALWCCYEKIDS
jgi:hypothetical protein